ncbi:MAG: tRNA pseudouridine(55) synthase TruB [Caldiserica bacterium]|nr:tRNA pseudouridine(55) synthase TruB [Caldisericota bacterium]
MDGFLIVNKPKGLTSHDVVEKVRKKFRVKTGHLGTLDPLATGVLPLAIGEATKLTSLLLHKDKEYTGEMVLGFATDTYDIEGKVVNKVERIAVNREDIEEAVKKFRGEIKQIPPMYSAIKKGGKRLYKWAREGVKVERKPREVNIFAFRILEFNSPIIKFYVHCSAGTYIRSLVNDLGESLACFATLKELKRLKSGPFHIKEACSLEEILSSPSISLFLKPMEMFLQDLKEVKVNPAFIKNLLQGTPIYKSQLLAYPQEVKKGEIVKVVNEKGRLLCLAESKFMGEEISSRAENNIVFQPRRVFRKA